MITPSLERRLAAVWFADIAGFTRLSAADEPLAYRVMEAMRASVRDSVEANGGTLVKFLGDGALSHFPSAEAAVEAALQVHRRFRAATRLLPEHPALRVGVHLGEVSVGPDGDLFGDGVNRAARLQAMAEPGQVLVSQAVRELLRQRPELVFTSLGKRTAKGLDDPVHVFEAKARGNLSDRLEAVERSTQPVTVGQGPAPGVKPLRRRHAGAIATGIVAGVLAFVGLGVWTAMGGFPESSGRSAASGTTSVVTAVPSLDAAPAVVDGAVMVAVVDSAPGEGPLPRWPATVPADTAAPAPAPPPPTPTEALRTMAAAASRRLAAFPVGQMGWDETVPVYRHAVDEAVAGHAKGAQLLALRGVLLFLERWDFEGADQSFLAALAKDPASISGRRFYAQLLSAEGRFGEALFQLERAAKAGMDEGALRAQRGATLLRMGRLDDAESELRRAMRSQPAAMAPRILLARTLVARGKPDDAVDVLSDGTPGIPGALWSAYARMHDKGDRARQARAGIPELVRAARTLPEGDYLLAVILAAAGQDAQAFTYLDRAIANRSPSVVWLQVDPEWEPLRGDPRYHQRLRTIGLER